MYYLGKDNKRMPTMLISTITAEKLNDDKDSH